MRIDKFLKVSRIIKRRTNSNQAADNGRISVNGKIVKPIYDIKVNDNVEIKFGNQTSKYKITAIPTKQSVRTDEVAEMVD